MSACAGTHLGCASISAIVPPGCCGPPIRMSSADIAKKRRQRPTRNILMDPSFPQSPRLGATTASARKEAEESHRTAEPPRGCRHEGINPAALLRLSVVRLHTLLGRKLFTTLD